MQDSCPHAKVRSYACNADGLRLVKIFRYVYDFDYNKCVPRVQRKTQSCRGEHPFDADGDGIDDVTGRPVNDYNRWKYDSPKHRDYDGYRDYADGYNWEDYGDYDYHPGVAGGLRHADEFTQKKSQAAHQKNV